jgi:SAM-dependent methyltransferase
VIRDVWEAGDSYEAYVGRWSRRVARVFVSWLDTAPAMRWLDVCCGTGALTGAVLAGAEPEQVLGVDRSAAFLADASIRTGDPRAVFAAGDAMALPVPAGRFEAVISGLALNFVPDAGRAAAEMARAGAAGAVVAAYVWDYAEGMTMMRHFWDAARAVDPAADAYDEGRRFPVCRPDALRAVWQRAGLRDVSTRRIEVPTRFAGFDDFWQPFLGGQGAAPAYLMSLPEPQRDAIREVLRGRLPEEALAMTAAAWAVRGVR